MCALTLTMSIVSCDRDVAIPPYKSFSDDFLKLQEGTTWLYQIDSIVTDIVEPNRHVTLFQKEVVRQVEITSRNATYTIDVYQSSDTAEGYELVDVYTMQLYDDRVVHMGSDYNIIVLTKPMDVGAKWFNLNNTCLNAQSVLNDKLDTYTHNETIYEGILDVIHYEYYHHDVSQSHRAYYGQDVGLIYEMRFDRLRNKKTTITKSLLSYAY